MIERTNSRESISKDEIERRWNIVFTTDWQSLGLTFEFEPKDDGWAQERVRTGLKSIRGKFKSIRQKEDNIVIETSNCYKYMLNGIQQSQEDLSLEIPEVEIVPSAHGDMLHLDHKAAAFRVFGVNSHLFSAHRQ